MEQIAIYANRKDNNRVFVIKVEALETGSRIHFTHGQNTKELVLGRNAFKKKYYNVAGVVV